MKPKPRILFLAKQLDSGGVTKGMSTLGQGLLSRGWQVAIASRGKVWPHTMTVEWFQQQGISHFPVVFPGRNDRLLNYPSILFKAIVSFDRVIRQYRPDIIHVHWRSTSPFARLAKLIHGVPVVSSLRLDGIPAGASLRFLSFWGDRAIAISTETYEYLRDKFQVPPSKIRTVYHGVDEEHFRPPTEPERLAARRELQVPLEDFAVCLVGRMSKGKRHDVLIKALAQLKSRGLRMPALFAGSGPLEKELKAMASVSGIGGSVHFLGFREEVRTVLWASDVLVLPSDKEGFPNVVVEGMLSGLVPIRTPAAGAYDQIENGVSGFIIPFSDDEALADRLERLFRSRDLRLRMAQSAFVSARKKFTTKLMIEKTIDVYQEVLVNSPLSKIVSASS